jgi:hypothetical protein
MLVKGTLLRDDFLPLGFFIKQLYLNWALVHGKAFSNTDSNLARYTTMKSVSVVNGVNDLLLGGVNDNTDQWCVVSTTTDPWWLVSLTPL